MDVSSSPSARSWRQGEESYREDHTAGSFICSFFCVFRVSCSSLTLTDTLISLSDHAQVDFPSPAVDVLYVGPQENVCPDPQSLEPLDPGDRSEIEKLCAQASAFGYVCIQKKPHGIK